MRGWSSPSMKDFIQECFQQGAAQDPPEAGEEWRNPMLLPCQLLKGDPLLMFHPAVPAWQFIEGKLGGESMATQVASVVGVESLDHGRELFESAWPIAIPKRSNGKMLPWVIEKAKNFRLPFESQL